ncbi:MAG TPA: hypothetical protein VGG14_02825 [Candidatus Sulfotelmatobacter sp.]|jgi:hypothetical protein
MKLLMWFIPLGLLSLLLAVLVRRRAFKILPFFFTYVTFAVAADLARFATLGHPHPYRMTYWITESIYDILGILVMYEVLRSVLGGMARSRLTRLILPVFVIVGIGLSLAHHETVPPRVTGFLVYIVLAEIAVRFVQVLVFAGLVTLVPLIGMRWRQYPFGVATGFGLYATVMLLTTVKFSDFGTRFKFLWGITSLVAYSVAVLIWIWFFSIPQKIETPVSELSAPSPGDLKKYKDALRRMR